MTSANFKDYFSNNKGNYKKFRPAYPDALFRYLVSLAPSNRVAWDCATGSGQAAEQLAEYFSLVVASDASVQQVGSVCNHKDIFYGVAQAENVPFASSSIDIITVAQGLHWFDIRLFFAEAGRVLKENGIIAVWTYNLLSIKPDLDEIIKYFYKKIVGSYWPPERSLVEDGYENICFPFHRIKTPSFSMTAEWSLEETLGYLRTWSAVNLYIKDKGSDPVDIIMHDLCEKWGESSFCRKIKWDLTVIIGKNVT